MIRNREFKNGFMALLTGLLVMALVAPVTAADREVKESGPASATGTVMVENISGSIVVVGWDKAEVSVEGTLSGDIEELRFKTGKNKTQIEVVYPKNQKNIKGEANLVINVPPGQSPGGRVHQCLHRGFRCHRPGGCILDQR